MKTKFVTFLLCCSCIYTSGQQYDKLDNNTIITLSKVGLPPATIISKIKTSEASFDVTVDALIDLRLKGVHGDVINEMMTRNDQVKYSSR